MRLIEKKYQFLILIFIILIVFGKTISYNFNLDDFIITDAIAGKTNNIYELFKLFKLSYNNTDYRPIVFFSFGLEQYFFGVLIPKYSHLINVLLFVLIAWSALKLFSILFDKKYNLLLFFAVLLFSVHPLNTEVVCSLKCRDNLLSMLLGLNSSILFIQFIQNKSYKWLRFLLFVFLSLAALLSKADAVGFLFFNLAYVVFFKKENKIKFIVFTFLCLVVISFLLSSFQNTMLFRNTTNTLKGQVTFTENPLALSFTLLNRFISFVNSVSFYFVKLIPISGFKYYYGYHQLDILSAASPSFYLGLLIIIALILVLIFAIKNENKILTLSISGIFLSSIYALNFFAPVAGIIADRYVFIANLFFCLMLVYLLQFVFSYFKKQSYFYIAILFLFISFCTLSFLRIPAWKNQKTLIDADAPNLYNSYEAMRIAAATYYKEYENKKDDVTRKKHLEKAIFYAEKGVQVYPKNSLLYLFLGQYYFKNNEAQKAISSFQKSLKNDTSVADASIYLGDVYYTLNKPDSALFYYKNAFKIDSTSNEVVNSISTVYFDMNDKQNCLKFNTDLIQNNTTLFAPYENLGYFYLLEKDTTKATLYFNTAVKKGMNQNGLPIKIK